MNKDYRSQKPPCSSLTVHMEHAQDLEETYASESTMPAKPSLLIPNVTSLNCLKDEIRTSLCYLIADVANTWPLDPTPSTIIEAMTTIKSVRRKNRALSTSVSVKCRGAIDGVGCLILEEKKNPGAPMIDMGFLIKRRRPLMPAYLLRQPADHSRTMYSVPKKSTSTISCRLQSKHKAGVEVIQCRNRSATNWEDAPADKGV